MFYAILAAAIVLTAFLMFSGFNYRNLSDEIRRLYSQSKNISGKTFSYKQLSGLPEPVKKYFRHVLKEGQPYISYVNLTHNGLFKTGKNNDWIKMSGEEYFTAEKPGFIWQGKTAMFTATDKYMNGQGNLKVVLLSVYNILNEKGEHYDQGELLRWLGESVWFPTNLLPNEHLQWSALDKNSAKLDFNYRGIKVSYNVLFNSAAEIVQLEAQRYMGPDKLETWVGKMSDYKMLNNVLIPTAVEASWKLKNGEFSYARFTIEEIDYQKSSLVNETL
ncbi:DUF6544 family protein [Flavobacterium sp.]|uniref:DUF6544 family protein n=1 Tax=Flavobacterium sp. TaxID=239 RepID=UPI0032630CCB